MSSDNEMIDRAVEAITFGVYDSGALTDPHRWWPESYLPYSPLFAGHFHSHWISQWRGLPAGRVGQSASGTALWVLLAMSSRSLKAMYDREERCVLFLALLEEIRATAAGDIFNGDGRHLVLTSEAAQEIVDRTTFHSAAEDGVDRAFSGLSAALLAYSEAVFFSANCTVRDIHGPYDVNYTGAPRKLLVRDYTRIRDTDLEVETGTISMDAVSVYSVYEPSVSFTFSVLNDYISDKPLSSVAVAHAANARPFEESGTFSSIDSVADVIGELERVISAVGARVRAETSLETALEVIRRTYYRGFPVAVAAAEDWEIPPAFRAELRTRLQAFEGGMPPAMTREDFGRMVDPRL
jgi:hypothetical protein